MHLPTALAIAAALVPAPQGPGRPPHGGHGEFPPFSTEQRSEPDLKVVLDDVDLASFGSGTTILCKPTVACSLRITLRVSGSKNPFSSTQVTIPASDDQWAGKYSPGKWISWKLNDAGKDKTLPSHASVELLLSDPSGDPTGTYFVITRGTPTANVDQTHGNSRIDPPTAHPMDDRAETVTFWLDGPARVEVKITRQHGSKNTLYDHKVYPYLALGSHEHRWEFSESASPKLVSDLYVARFDCTQQDPDVPVEIGCALFRVVPTRRHP